MFGLEMEFYFIALITPLACYLVAFRLVSDRFLPTTRVGMVKTICTTKGLTLSIGVFKR